MKIFVETDSTRGLTIKIYSRRYSCGQGNEFLVHAARCMYIPCLPTHKHSCNHPPISFVDLNGLQVSGLDYHIFFEAALAFTGACLIMGIITIVTKSRARVTPS